MEILKKISSFEAKLQEKIDQYSHSKQFNESLEMEIHKNKETLRQLTREKAMQKQENGNLTRRRVALEKQVDGLLKKQAALLEVQPDIDLVSEALPARKRELEQLEQQIKEEGTLIAAAHAMAALFAKKPYDRNAVVQWLKLTEHNTVYGPFDELTRQTVGRLMAEQGFVPFENLEALKKKAEKEIANCKGQTETWRRIARKRSGELEECQEQLKTKKAAKDKKLDESINKGIANIITELPKKLQPSQNNTQRNHRTEISR